MKTTQLLYKIILDQITNSPSIRTDTYTFPFDGKALTARVNETDNGYEILISSSIDITLHYGEDPGNLGDFAIPRKEFQPKGASVFGNNQAVRVKISANSQPTRIVYPKEEAPGGLRFVVQYGDQGQWRLNNPNIFLPVNTNPNDNHKFRFDGYTLTTNVDETEDEYIVSIRSTAPKPIIFHYGISRNFQNEWLSPGENCPGNPSQDNKSRQLEIPPDTEVQIRFSKEEAPLGLPFVIKVGPTDQDWRLNNTGNVFLLINNELLEFLEKDISGITARIIGFQKTSDKWTRGHTYVAATQILGGNIEGFGINIKSDSAPSLEKLSLIYTWLRYYQIDKTNFPETKNYNIKPRETAGYQDALLKHLTNLYLNNSDPTYRKMLRLIAGTLGNASNGQSVRDFILYQVMERKDCNIPKKRGTLIEEWHQKLHNSAGPEDIFICGAIQEGLRKGIAAYLAFLTEHGLSHDELAREVFGRMYKFPPLDDKTFSLKNKHNVIDALENYLVVLKDAFEEASLQAAIKKLDGKNVLRPTTIATSWDIKDKIVEFAKRNEHLSNSQISDILTNTLNIRREINSKLISDNSIDNKRDLFYLDVALEKSLRNLVEKYQQQLNENLDTAMNTAGLIMQNILIPLEGKDEKLQACFDLWQRQQKIPQHQRDEMWHKITYSALMQIQIYFIEMEAEYQRLMKEPAEMIGSALGTEEAKRKPFIEEVYRGHEYQALMMMVDPLMPDIRKKAGLGDIQVISPNANWGTVQHIASLADVQHQTFPDHTILVVDKVLGSEDIPRGVVAIITRSGISVVSHSGVRGRDAGVTLASVYDDRVYQEFLDKEGNIVTLMPKSSTQIEILNGQQIADDQNGHQSTPITLQKLQIDFETLPNVITPDQFTKERTGTKALNLEDLIKAQQNGRLSDWIYLPRNAAFPYGIFNKIMGLTANNAVREEYLSLTKELRRKDLPAKEVSSRLADIRQTISGMNAPADLQEDIIKAIQTVGIDISPEYVQENWEQSIWPAIKEVLASKWTDRAYNSRLTNGIPHQDVFMSVLIQKIFDAEYAYVSHSKNPQTNDENEIYAEVVAGNGESLVGNAIGEPLSFTTLKDDRSAINLINMPSKVIARRVKTGLIFRSNTNAEDLGVNDTKGNKAQNYAGAGLYESVPSEATIFEVNDYSQEPLVTDAGFREQIAQMIAEATREIEIIYGYPVDIEGVIFRNPNGELKLAVVQVRPQV
ncbi:MAG: PEP/pyruvate-binding domain-containing protein [Candidatus Margulisiibacteriota bacterium]